jgi:AraC family transcriptional regulator
MTKNTYTNLLTHQNAINRVIDYIEGNICNNIELEHLAQVASLSKFHFLRVFKTLLGETPMQFLSRLRLEKIAAALISKPNSSISEICYEHGFTNMTIFAKNFKKHFGISATEWRKNENSNLGKVISNNRKSFQEPSMYFCQQSRTIKWKTQMKQNKLLEIRGFQPFSVAYVRHLGAYQVDDKVFETLWSKLYSWAAPKDYLSQTDLKSLIVYHDDPNLTSHGKQRMSFCISVPENAKTDGEIGKMKIEGGKYVVAGFELTSNEFPLAWEFVMNWFPTSGLEPKNGPSFELYPEQPKDYKFKVEICIPLKS